jgi:hypothetical protein
MRPVKISFTAGIIIKSEKYLSKDMANYPNRYLKPDYAQIPMPTFQEIKRLESRGEN